VGNNAKLHADQLACVLS